MNNNYYFVKPYDHNLALPPTQSITQILDEAYMHPFTWHARTTRRSYWVSFLINVLLSIFASDIFSYAINDVTLNLGLRWVDGVVSITLLIWLFLASLGQTIRRLHDVNYSGKWYWIGYLPLGGYLFLLYLAFQPSVQRPVRYGTYMFIDPTRNRTEYYYQPYDASWDAYHVPVPKISQILKEHFFQCFTWNARSTRRSYWIASIFNNIFTIIYSIAAYTLALLLYYQSGRDAAAIRLTNILLFIVPILSIIALWFLVAQIAHMIRRLHDANLNGAWVLLLLLPYIGPVLLDFLLFHPTVSLNNPFFNYPYLFKNSDLKR